VVATVATLGVSSLEDSQSLSAKTAASCASRVGVTLKAPLLPWAALGSDGSDGSDRSSFHPMGLGS